MYNEIDFGQNQVQDERSWSNMDRKHVILPAATSMHA
jgi:hypothetical protein